MAGVSSAVIRAMYSSPQQHAQVRVAHQLEDVVVHRRFADIVTRLLVSYAVSAPDDPPEVVAASIATFLVDARGRIARRWLGLEQTAAQMRDEITALADATPAGS